MADNTGNIQLAFDPAQLELAAKRLAHVRNGLTRAATVAINRTASTVASRTKRGVAKLTGIRAKTIGKNVQPFKANFRSLVGGIKVMNFPIPLVLFKHKQTRQGIQATTPDRGTFTIPHAFQSKTPTASERRYNEQADQQYARGIAIQRVRASGSQQVFLRRGKGRLPIDKQYGPSPRAVFEKSPGFAAQELGNAQDTLAKNLASQTERLIAGRNPDTDSNVSADS